MSARFEIGGDVSVDQAPEVRRFVERMHARALNDRDLISRVAMATHELFENAVKFSTDGLASLRVDLSRDTVNNIVKITTKNRAHQSDLDGLRELSRGLRESSDVMTFYIELMRRAPGSRGGLGLCRVAAEGEMRLALEIEDDTVIVHAELTEPLP